MVVHHERTQSRTPHVARYCLGASQRALETAANYTDNRIVNERPVSDYQAVNHQIAEMVTKLDAAFLLNKSVVQHDAYDVLADDEFDGEYVGNEVEGRPWDET